ncbi:MAG: ABC transporter permease [Kofleriaceae bacterium]
MGSIWLDVRYAFRMMVKSPGLTAVLVITLALGIGASTTIFSVVNSVVLRPLPYEQPDQLVRVYTEFTGGLGLKKFWVSPPEFEDLRNECKATCERVGAWADGTASLAGGDRPIRIEAAYTTHEVLPLLGVKPLLGRWYDKSEDQPGDPKVVVLGYDVWKRVFGGDPSIIGRTIRLDAMPVTVIGVMPAGFDFLGRQQAWVPLAHDFVKHRHRRGSHSLHVVVRLKADATITSFRQELGALVDAWGKSKGHAIQRGFHPMIGEPFHQDLIGSLSTTLWLLQGAVLFVLLIAIVNVANLLLARSETRTREVAVRHALGASRRRLIRQFVTESLILGLIGGALGILVAVWAVDGVTTLVPKSAPRANEITLDSTAVMFAIACSLLAALLFGLAPIVHARRTDLHGALKDGSNRMTGSKARLRVRRALVITEIALAVVLVIGCTVMVRSFVKLQEVKPGFSPSNMLTFELELPPKTYPGVTGAVFWKRHLDRMRSLPGVTHAALLSGLPPLRSLDANDINFPTKTRVPAPFGIPWNVDYWQTISDDGMAALGSRIVKGREILPSDTPESPKVVLVNEAFAKRFFAGEEPLGQKVRVRGRDKEDPIQTVVGVVADIKQNGIDKPPGTEIFIPAAQYQNLLKPPESPKSLYTVLRTQGDPGALIPAIQRAVAEIDPTLPISKMRSMDDVLWEAVARPRFLTFLLTAFAGLALLLAAVGIYGVMSHTVAQRTHEIGLRVALGAQPKQVRAMVLRQAGSLVALGVIVGLGVAVALEFAIGTKLRGLFYGDDLSQPLLLAGVAVAVTFTALLATWIPVRRATKVEPTVALRSE